MQKEKNKQTVLERKQQMGHLITRCPAFILLERSIWGCSLAPIGTICRYRVFSAVASRVHEHPKNVFFSPIFLKS